MLFDLGFFQIVYQILHSRVNFTTQNTSYTRLNLLVIHNVLHLSTLCTYIFDISTRFIVKSMTYAKLNLQY